MTTDEMDNTEGVEPEVSDTAQPAAEAEATGGNPPAEQDTQTVDDSAGKTASKKSKKKKKKADSEPAALDEKASDNEYAFNARQAKRKHQKFAQGARFVNSCTFTRAVYREYLRGAQPRSKTIIMSIAITLFVFFLAIGINFGMDLPMIALSLMGIAATSLIFAQPWMLAVFRTDKAKMRYGEFQHNVTYFYEDGLLMNNINADAQAYAYYTDIRELKESEDFIYMFVNKACYFAILTGFAGGEEEIPEFRKFIAEKAVNAKNGLKQEDPESDKKKKKKKKRKSMIPDLNKEDENEGTGEDE